MSHWKEETANQRDNKPMGRDPIDDVLSEEPTPAPAHGGGKFRLDNEISMLT